MSILAYALDIEFDLVVSVIELLRERGETVATAESLTAGLVCATLTEVPGASAVVRGGLVVYATELKATLAEVPWPMLKEHGAVWPGVADALATGVRHRCKATWGIGLTGVAGPDPQDGVEPGTVFIAVTDATFCRMRTLRVDGDRHEVRSAAVRAALEVLRSRLDRE